MEVEIETIPAVEAETLNKRSDKLTFLEYLLGIEIQEWPFLEEHGIPGGATGFDL